MSHNDLYRMVEKACINVSSSALQRKKSKDCLNNLLKKKEPQFGIIFDVDGVLARGTLAIPRALEGMKLLQDDKGNSRVPMCFVTNALNRDEDKAKQISGWFNMPVAKEQLVQAPGPLRMFTKLHNKFCLIIGQGKVKEIAKDLGFKNFCTLDQVSDAYPLLDMVDHGNRKKIAEFGYEAKGMNRVEAIILLGEPKNWSCALQLIIDLLRSSGKPDQVPDELPERHIPVIACNMDLQFMDRATIPRFGHGAFLLCLEALYKKITGYDLQYTALVGKPSETTFRYAEHCLTIHAKKLGFTEPLKTIYVVGDTPDSDIVGANLYQRYVRRMEERRKNKADPSADPSYDPELPQCRNVPADAHLHPQSVDNVVPLLVCTGVYKPGENKYRENEEKFYHGHRDFAPNPALYKPARTQNDVCNAIEYVLEKEGIV